MTTTRPEIIAVSFQKGGTGKTFTALNLAGGLAARGFRVLLIDTDPQGTLTANLGFRDTFDDIDQLSLDEVLLDTNKWDAIDDLILTSHPEFDVIPSNMSFDGNKSPLDSADAGEKRLGRVLDRLETPYHYVICDCPPDFSAYSKNAVTAGEQVVVPMVPRSEMIHSTNLLWEKYETLALVHELDITYLAYLMTYDSTKVSKEAQEVIDWFKDTFTDNGVLVDDRAAFDRAKWEQQSIYQYAEARANDQFAAFDELVQRVMTETTPPVFADSDDIEAMKAIGVDELRKQDAEVVAHDG